MFEPEVYASQSEWEKAVKRKQMRLQWQDRHPSGARLEIRAIQLGLRGSVLDAYARDWIVKIEQISEFVRQQPQNIKFNCVNLHTLRNSLPPVNANTVNRLGLSAKTA